MQNQFLKIPTYLFSNASAFKAPQKTKSTTDSLINERSEDNE